MSKPPKFGERFIPPEEEAKGKPHSMAEVLEKRKKGRKAPKGRIRFRGVGGRKEVSNPCDVVSNFFRTGSDTAKDYGGGFSGVWEGIRTLQKTLYAFNTKPRTTGNIDADELYATLSHKFPGCKVYMSDYIYRTPSTKTIKKFLADDKTNLSRFIPDTFDCDDFAVRLWGGVKVPGWSDTTVGLCWFENPDKTVHALNLFVDEDREIWFVEPQSDNVFSPPEGLKPFIIMI